MALANLSYLKKGHKGDVDLKILNLELIFRTGEVFRQHLQCAITLARVHLL